MKDFLNKQFGAMISLFSLVGLVATFWQTAEKIQLLKYPNDPLSCNINPVVDCGSVLTNDLSAVFGVPNSMIGMVIFSMLLTIGLMLMLNVKLSEGAKRLSVVLSLMLFAFSVWFFYVSLYVIGKVCIFCIFIWASSIPLTFLLTGQYGTSLFPKSKLIDWKLKWFKTQPWQPVILVYVLAIVLFLFRFRDYYF